MERSREIAGRLGRAAQTAMTGVARWTADSVSPRAAAAFRVARTAGHAFFDGLALVGCGVCGVPLADESRPVCAPCAARLPWWRRADGCPRCGMPVDPAVPGSEAGWGGGDEMVAGCPACLVAGSPLHLCLSATRYAGPLPGLVLGFKNPRGPFGPRPSTWRAIEYLADELTTRIQCELGVRPDFVVPIPLHPRRLQRRGFNAADLIARRIAWRLGRPFDPALLERIRHTGSQAGRPAPERRENLRGAFRVRRSLPGCGGRIFLVDDVLTTGSTLEAAANALLAAGAREVWALTLSATVARRRAGAERGTYARPPHQP